MREQVTRSSHAAIGDTPRDPIKLLEGLERWAGRSPVAPALRAHVDVPVRIFRGTAIIQAHDLANTPHTGLIQQICGDCHLMNFGGFATPERNLSLDINDFDEAHPGPWEGAVKRLAASVALAVRHLGLKAGAADASVLAAIQNYQTKMASYGGMGARDLWYD